MSRRRLVILLYHRVTPEPDDIYPDNLDVAAFQRQMQVLARYFRVLPLRDAIGLLSGGRLPPRAVSVTFDDGYADNLMVAAPVMQAMKIPGTVFVASGFCNGPLMWNDVIIESVRRTRMRALDLSDFGLGRVGFDNDEAKRSAIPKILTAVKYREPAERQAVADAICEQAEVQLPADVMLSESQISALADAGLAVGAHTVTHPILARLSEEQAAAEIVDSKLQLERITGTPVDLFAYPNGRPGEDYGARDVQLVRSAGFEAAFSTRSAAADASSDLFELPRFAPWRESAARFALRLLRMHVGPSVGSF